jgi:alkylated DNA repair dioxygenase AlkB
MLFQEPIEFREAGANVIYYPDFLDAHNALDFFEKLENELHWQPDTLKIFGKTITTARLYAWHGDEAFDYAYSGKSRIAEHWTPTLHEIKKAVEEKTGVSFNCCLLNYYADGTQGMAWHSDDEKVMQENGIIASISLGADRFFEFKHKTLDIRQKILLENGSLLVMQGETQKYYLHQLPKSKKVQEARINLTFRRFEEGDKHHRN